jgi:hypothetical protein
MIRVNAKRLACVAGAWMLAWMGCVTEVLPAEVGPAGSARVVFVLPRSTPTDAVERVTVSVSQGEFSSTTELEGSGVVWQGSLRGIPARQHYLFRAEAFDSEEARRFEAEVDSEQLELHRPALIILVGQEPGAVPLPGNTPPSLLAVVGSRVAVEPGGSIQLRAVASDQDTGDELSYTWQADEGTFDDSSAVSPRWTAPASFGQRTMTLVVRDSHGGVTSLTFTLDVTDVGTLSDRTEVLLNRWPAASDLAVLPSKIVSVGQEVTLELRGAVDADGDELTYTWTATCKGDARSGEGTTFHFTPTELPESTACDNCQVHVRIEDAHGGSASYSAGLCVQNRLPPTVRSTTPSALSARPGEVLTMGVVAEDPSGGPLTFTWSANTGTLGAPVQTGNTSEVPWTAVSCVPAEVRPTVEVTITNLAGLSTTVRFGVMWNGPACGHPPCNLLLVQPQLTLRADCTTDKPVFIPDGFTLDGAGRSLVAVDPVGGTFTGAILRNHGTVMHVRNLKLSAQGLLKDGPCDAGDDRLRGILLLGASGSVRDSEVLGIRRNQPAADNPEGTPRGCQEGFAIEVRNRDASVQRQVELLRNQVSGYQKVGILVAGRVNATVTDNVLTGAGPVAHIAQNGIQLSDGATGQVTGNQLSGHSYTGGADVATGILVAGGPYYGIALVRDALIQRNTLVGNDVGISLSQAEADGSGLTEPTRIQVLDNTLRNDAVTNSYPYQAAISDLGGGNTIHSNVISGAGYDPATQPGATFAVDVTAGPASQLVFLTPPRGAVAGTCSGKLVVQSQDARGNLSRPASAMSSLTAQGGAASGLAFFADPRCEGPEITMVDLSTPEAAATFYFKAAQGGALTIQVSNGTLSGAQVQTP